MNNIFSIHASPKKVYSNLWQVLMSGCLSLDSEATAEFTMTNHYSRADSTTLLEVKVWALTDLDVEEEGAGWGVAVSVTLQRHIISLYDGPLGHNLQANLLRWI